MLCEHKRTHGTIISVSSLKNDDLEWQAGHAYASRFVTYEMVW